MLKSMAGTHDTHSADIDVSSRGGPMSRYFCNTIVRVMLTVIVDCSVFRRRWAKVSGWSPRRRLDRIPPPRTEAGTIDPIAWELPNYRR